MRLHLRLRSARVAAAVRTYLGLPTPFDEDQDDYWIAIPRATEGEGRAACDDRG